MSKKDKRILNSFMYAFPKTVPIMTGFLFLGVSYGIMMGINGFPFYYPMAALFTMLVVYCLKGIDFLSGSHGIPEAVAIAVTVALHLLFKRSLLFVAGGTAVYLLFVNVFFV